MFDELVLRVKNWETKQKEKAGKGDVDVLVPANRDIREVSESLLLDGAKPSEINDVTIGMLGNEYKEIQERQRVATEKELEEIRDSLKLETSDSNEIEEVVAGARERLELDNTFVTLHPVNPVRKVDISKYHQESEDDSKDSKPSFFKRFSKK